MKGLTPLFLGILGTFFFSWAGLTMIPNAQIGHLDPQMDEEGTDIYPAPKSGMAERGRRVYVANGCVYCHSQQVRPDWAASDIERKWGERRSAPRDYIFERPALLGRMRMGPDLANVGKRAPSDDENAPPPGSTNVTAVASPAAPAPAGAPAAAPTPAAAPSPASSTGSSAPAVATAGTPAPAAATAAQTADASAAQAGAPTTIGPDGEPLPYSAAWHHRHLYAPRSITSDSIMPSFRFLYEKRRVSGQPAANALVLRGDEAPEEGRQIVPSYDAECLVAYLMSLDQAHALNEVKPTAPVSPPAPGKAVQ